MDNEKKPTREEIVRSLRCCASDSCDGCPQSVKYSFDNEYRYDSECLRKMADAAADLIDEMTDRCARYAEEIMELKEQLRKYRLAETVAERQNEKGCPLAPWCDAVKAAENNKKEKQA